MSTQDRPTPEQMQSREMDREEHRTGMQAGVEQAQRGQIDPRELLSEEFIGEVTDLDVDREVPDDHEDQTHIGRKVGSYGSKQTALGNISKEEWLKQKKLDKARRHLVRCHFRRPGGTGSKCTGATQKRMTSDGHEPKPVLTDDLDEQLDGAFEARTMLRSGAIGGRILRLIGEVTVNTRRDQQNSSSESSGLLGSITDKLGI